MPTADSVDDTAARRVRLSDARVTLFGHEPSTARLELRARPRRWRLRRAAVPALATLVLAPLAALVPPHAPWAVGALLGGAAWTRRRWKEEFTVLAFHGACPRCGTALEVEAGTRLRFPHTLACDACRHEPVLELDRERLRASANGTA